MTDDGLNDMEREFIEGMRSLTLEGRTAVLELLARWRNGVGPFDHTGGLAWARAREAELRRARESDE